jgi:hypothetical protein
MKFTALLLPAVALATVPCTQTNWDCINPATYCLQQITRDCAAGTFCSTDFHKLHPNESPCITAPNSYGCDRKTWQCKISTGSMNETSCAEGCVKPSPPPPTPPPTPPPAPAKCNAGGENYLCYSAAGFCKAGEKFPCYTGSYCSPVFHKAHPSESPCILPEYGWGCDSKTKRCTYETGRFNQTYCNENCR